jgi:hypothetical protein
MMTWYLIAYLLFGVTMMIVARKSAYSVYAAQIKMYNIPLDCMTISIIILTLICMVFITPILVIIDSLPKVCRFFKQLVKINHQHR